MERLLSKNKFLLCFLLLIGLIACQNKRFVNHRPELIPEWEKWRLDTMGCRGVRITMLNKLLSLNNDKKFINQTGIEDVLKIFGTPEYSFIMIGPGHLYFSYFYKSSCEVPESSCKAEYLYMMEPTVDFIFENGILTSISTDAR